MTLTPSGWQHEGAGCQWWRSRAGAYRDKPCRHMKEAEKQMSETELERAIVPAQPGIVINGEVMAPGELYRLVDEFDADLVSNGVAPDVVESWCYTFPSGGSVVTGLSIRGVEAAVRLMSQHGEVIRASQPVTEYEDENEIRMSCTAIRLVINPNTQMEIELDRCTRAIRQQKKMRLRNGGMQDDDKWYEKAFSKVQRNALLPMLRQDVKSEVLAAYKQTPKFAALGSGRPYNPQQITAPSEDQRRPAPTRRQNEQRPQQLREPAPTTANAPATPPAPPERAETGITKDTQNAIAKVMTDVGGSRSAEDYLVVYKDLMRTFPEAVIANRLTGIKTMSEDRALEMLSRLRVWQAGEDPGAAEAVDAALPPEPEEGVWEEAPQ